MQRVLKDTCEKFKIVTKDVLMSLSIREEENSFKMPQDEVQPIHDLCVAFNDVIETVAYSS